MQPQPLIEWPQPLLELLQFIAWYTTLGAVGFRVALARSRLSDPRTAAAPELQVIDRALLRAAWIGLAGAVLGAVLYAFELPGMAERQKVLIAELITSGQPAIQTALLLVALLGFWLALRRLTAGWALAAIGVIGGVLRGALFSALSGQWTRIANPVHVLAGGLWIGTLFMLVAAGLSSVLASGLPSERRGAMAAALVNAFSPLALASVAVLAFSGVNTAWIHLKSLEALWTTPYGVVLIVKLCVVVMVLVLGAWNWRRQRPGLGSENAAVRLRRSATAELVFAAVVLCLSAILVSLPSPRPPGAPSGPPPGGPPE